MLETFQVLHIEEPDFGCEGLRMDLRSKTKYFSKAISQEKKRSSTKKMPDCMSWTSTRATKCF